jgi:ribosomal protein S3
MGQKVNPIGFRLGINRTWDSRWYADRKEYGRLLHEDIKIRAHLNERLKQAGVSRIIIERPHKTCRITIHSARQEGRRHRKAEERSPEVHRRRSASEHRGNPQARDRCQAGGREHRPAA